MKFFDEVKEKINKKIKPENIILIDNSNLHNKHKSFDKNKFHLKLFIKSKDLTSISKIHSTKIIYKILELELKKYIHSIQIVLNSLLYL